MTSLQPDPSLFVAEARGRRLKEAEADIIGICDGVIETALVRADSAFDDNSMTPHLALQLIAQINSSRRIQKRFRKTVKDGIAAAEKIYG